MQGEQPCWSATGLAVAWFDTLEMTRRYIHRCDVVMVEMLADASILNAGRDSLAGVFDISASRGVVSSALTKGFVACGYDETGVLVQNSLGVSCGELGFHRISNELFGSRLVKGAAILNLF